MGFFCLAVKGEKLCELCQHVMGFVENLLRRNDTEEKIQQYLELACLLAPEKDRDVVRAFLLFCS